METNTCPDCGSAPVNHKTEWWTNWFDHWSNRYFKPLEYIRQIIQPLVSALPWNSLILAVVWIGSHVGIIEIRNSLLPTDSSRTKVLWEAAMARKIVVQRILLFGMPTEICIARYGKQSRVYMSMPRPYGPPSKAYFWMDNKAIMQKKFLNNTIPVPVSFECRTISEAVKAFRTINRTVIVKPSYGSRSRHTTVSISNEAALAKAFAVAQQISPWVMVQEELPGMVHRVLWVGNKIIAVMRREPAYVTGNGSDSVKVLLEQANKNPLRHGPIFHELPTGAAVLETLRQQKMDWNTVPELGAIVILNPKVSRGNGAVNVDVTDNTHPVNMQLFKTIGSFVNDPIVGVDFIIRDIARPWTEQLPCGVIECNALPYVDLHSYPFSGPVRDAAGAVWEIVFPGTAVTHS